MNQIPEVSQLLRTDKQIDIVPFQLELLLFSRKKKKTSYFYDKLYFVILHTRLSWDIQP